jgi:hypothetical protein
MMEAEKIRCKSCDAWIEFERPHFCPFCGAELDAAQGLTEDEPEQGESLYPLSGAAPYLMRMLLIWLGSFAIFVFPHFAIPSALYGKVAWLEPLVITIFSRKVFIIWTLTFALCVSIFLVLSLWVGHQKESK